jgi:hypothetical protein
MAAKKFTQGVRTTILDALRAGNTLTHSAGLAGVSRAVVYQWLTRGKDAPAGSAYRQFAEDVEQANAEAAARLVQIVSEAAVDDWRAAMTLLERRFPDEYAKRERHEVAGPQDGPIKVELVWPTGAEPPR